MKSVTNVTVAFHLSAIVCAEGPSRWKVMVNKHNHSITCM